MRYFKDTKSAVYGYDETVESQLPYIQNAINAGWQEITGSWPPKETQAQAQIRLSAVITSAINNGAQGWGYDSIESGVSYVNSTNLQYVAEAKALSKWRDEVWAWGIPALVAVKPEETDGEFLSGMPEFPQRPVV
jgi:hypothetical protein